MSLCFIFSSPSVSSATSPTPARPDPALTLTLRWSWPEFDPKLHSSPSEAWVAVEVQGPEGRIPMRASYPAPARCSSDLDYQTNNSVFNCVGLVPVGGEGIRDYLLSIVNCLFIPYIPFWLWSTMALNYMGLELEEEMPWDSWAPCRMHEVVNYYYGYLLMYHDC
jgi:hypothetical protein